MSRATLIRRTAQAIAGMSEDERAVCLAWAEEKQVAGSGKRRGRRRRVGVGAVARKSRGRSAKLKVAVAGALGAVKARPPKKESKPRLPVNKDVDEE